jgi:hypothetical protein
MPEMIAAGGWHASALESDIVVDAQGRRTPGVIGRFRKHRVLDIPKSRAADEAVYREVIVCEERVKGQDDVSARHLKAHNYRDLAAKFPQAWAEFEGETLEVTGTPLEKLELGTEKVMALWCEGIRSVEDLAQTPDPVCERLGFGTKTLRAKAAAYLDGLAAQVAKPSVLKGKTRAMVMGTTAQTRLG